MSLPVLWYIRKRMPEGPAVLCTGNIGQCYNEHTTWRLQLRTTKGTYDCALAVSAGTLRATISGIGWGELGTTLEVEHQNRYTSDSGVRRSLSADP